MLKKIAIPLDKCHEYFEDSFYSSVPADYRQSTRQTVSLLHHQCNDVHYIMRKEINEPVSKHTIKIKIEKIRFYQRKQLGTYLQAKI